MNKKLKWYISNFMILSGISRSGKFFSGIYQILPITWVTWTDGICPVYSKPVLSFHPEHFMLLCFAELKGKVVMLY